MKPSEKYVRDHNSEVLSFYRSRYSGKDDVPKSIHFGYTPEGDPPPDDEAEMHEMNRVLAGEISLTGDDAVLDAGCGFGGSSVWLASEYGCRVTGLNLVEDQLPHARAHAESTGVSDLTDFVAGDFTDTGLPASSFDVVWAIESICHTPDKPGFLRESARLLKPGGRLVVADFFLTGKPLARRRRAAVDRFASGWSIPGLPEVSDLKETSEEAGLLDFHVRDISRNVLPSSRRIFREAVLRSYPKNLVWTTLGLRPAEEFTNARSCVEQYLTLKRGSWFYGILSATRSNTQNPL